VQALLLNVPVASDAAAFFGAVTPRNAAMVAVETEGGLMNPLFATALETATIAELYLLAKLIETIIAENEEPPEERQTTFVNRELVRRALSERGRTR
jgi:hypothetical protein